MVERSTVNRSKNCERYGSFDRRKKDRSKSFFRVGAGDRIGNVNALCRANEGRQCPRGYGGSRAAN
jgi:hypothetical protein